MNNKINNNNLNEEILTGENNMNTKIKNTTQPTLKEQNINTKTEEPLFDSNGVNLKQLGKLYIQMSN